MRTAFGRYAETHEASSIRRCWSSWNVLCTYLFTSELIAANPMPQIGRPKIAKTLPKSPAGAVTALLSSLRDDRQPQRPCDWLDRDRALILTALLAGPRSEELIGTNVGDLRRTDDGAVIHVRGKGGKDRRIPIEPPPVDVIETYLHTRAACYPATTRCRSPAGGLAAGLAAWSPTTPLFVGADGDRNHPRHTAIPSTVGLPTRRHRHRRARGALVHGLRHTFATELANANVSVYTLMKLLLQHESMVTSQRYVDGAGIETRAAAELNPLYDLLNTPERHS